MPILSRNRIIAPDIIPADLLEIMLKITPPITLAEKSFHQKQYEAFIDYFDMREKKPDEPKSGEPSDEAKRADKLAREGLSKT
jgi:hypothetical protein